VKVLVIDIGGNSVKALATGASEPRKFPSGRTLRPQAMVSAVRKLTEDWDYDAVSIGYPGRARENRPVSEPNNLGPGWVRFDFEKALGLPVRLVNDAAMQALGSYRGGTMLFLGLGTGLGTALVVHGTVVPMELGQLSYRRGTYEGYLGLDGLKRLGIAKWRDVVREVVARFVSALEVEDVVIGGGNVNKMDRMPPGCRAGDNAHAFRGGFLLWNGTRLDRRVRATNPRVAPRAQRRA
jgi:polyphosphate glucokinase